MFVPSTFLCQRPVGSYSPRTRTNNPPNRGRTVICRCAGWGGYIISKRARTARFTVVKGAAAVLVLLIASPAGAAIWRCPQSNGGVMFTDQAEAECEPYTPQSGYVVGPPSAPSVAPQPSAPPEPAPPPVYVPPPYDEATSYPYPYPYPYDYGPYYYSGIYVYPGWFWSRPRAPFFVVPRHSGPRHHNGGPRLMPSPTPRHGSPSFRGGSHGSPSFRGGGHSGGRR